MNLLLTHQACFETFFLARNSVRYLKGKSYQFNCLEGAVWVTWPNGNETVLQSGGSFNLTAKGKICIQALSQSTLQISDTGKQ